MAAMTGRRIGLGPKPPRVPEAEAWVKDGGDATATLGDVYAARLTIDVTPELRGRIKVIAFGRGLTVAAMLRALLEREYGASDAGCCTMNQLTRVALACMPDCHGVWLRFGQPMHKDVPEGQLRHVYFAPGDVFARVESRAGDRRRVAILRAAGPGEEVICFPGIEPGAQLLLHASTTAKSLQVLQAIDAIEAQGIAAHTVSEDYWRVLHQRLVAGVEPPAYTAAEHAAMRQRRGLPA